MLMTAHPTARASSVMLAYAAFVVIVLTAYLRAPGPTDVSTSAPVVAPPSIAPATSAPPVSVAVTGTLPPAPSSSALTPSVPVASTTRPTVAVSNTTAKPTTTIAGYGYLDCVRHRESRAQYAVVNPSSRAGGAYQFLPATWDATARRAGRYDLVGVHPSHATRRDQDAMAAYLLSWQGRQHWAGPGC